MTNTLDSETRCNSENHDHCHLDACGVARELHSNSATCEQMTESAIIHARVLGSVGCTWTVEWRGPDGELRTRSVTVRRTENDWAVVKKSGYGFGETVDAGRGGAEADAGAHSPAETGEGEQGSPAETAGADRDAEFGAAEAREREQQVDEPGDVDDEVWLQTASVRLHLGMLEMADALANMTWKREVGTLRMLRCGPYKASVHYYRKGDREIPAGWTWSAERNGNFLELGHGVATEVEAKALAETAIRRHWYGWD